MYKVGQRIRINFMNDKYSSDIYTGREGVITQVNTDPWGDIYLVGTWGGLTLYPKIDKIEIIG